MSVYRYIFAIVAVVGFGVIGAVTVHADSYGGGSIQGYAADAAVDTGSIVSLTGKDSNKVQLAEQSKVENMFGVVVDRAQVPIAISSPSVANETYVAVSGTYNVLVSTQGGAIAAGDYITLSAVNGVGMKANTTQKTVFGRAAAAFNGKGVTLGSTVIKDTTGKANQTVTIGSIPVSINIQHNPNIQSTKVDVPPFLEKLGQQIAQKQVSPVRIYLSLAITAVSLITALIVVYAGVRNGIIAIGRNPMTKKSIFRALFEVILTSLLILIIGLFAVYLLLKL